MHTIDGNGGILPDTGMPLLKAAHVTVVKRPQSRNIGLYALLLLLRRHVGSLPVEPVTDLVKMTLRLLQRTETDIIGESPPADMFHRTLHLTFLPSRTRITEMRGETIVEFHAAQGIGMFALLSKELLDGHPHVIVGHYLRRAPQSTEAVAVCFHQGQRVLAGEQVCPPQVAMVHREHGHVQLRLDTGNPKCQHAPVKLAPEPRFILLADERRRGLGWSGHRHFQCTDILAYRRIGNLYALIAQPAPHVNLAHLLLAQSGRGIRPVAGHEAVYRLHHLLVHHSADTFAAVIAHRLLQVRVHCFRIGVVTDRLFESPEILAYSLAAHAVTTGDLTDAQSVTPIGENYGISFFHVVHIMNAIGFYEYTNFVRLNIPMGGALFKCCSGSLFKC